jgi:hypothetical protein
LYTHRKDIPGDWVLIVEHCLQKEPGQRYQTTRDLLDDLRSDRASFHANAAPLDDYATLLDDRLGASPIQTPDNAAASKPDEGYQFQFLSGVENKPPPDRFKTEVPVRSIKNLLEPTPTSKTQRSASMMVFGGVLAWIGMLALVAAGLFSVFNLLQEEANRSVTPAALVMLAGTGATLFALGALLELPEADSQETILLGTMVFGAAMVCALIAVGSLLGDGGFLFAGVGAALSVALTVMYLSIKGF